MVAQPATSHSYPWTIVMFLPNAQRYTIAQFYNRQDANDHLRAMRRFVPNQKFEIVFEPPPDDSF